MGHSLPVSDELVKALFLQGLSIPEISKATGLNFYTVRARISRNKWRNLREEQKAKALPKQITDFQAVAERLTSLAVDQAERLMLFLKDQKIKDMSTAKSAAQTLSTSYATARKALGMDDTDNVQKHLHVHVMRDVKTVDLDVATQGVENVSAGAQEAKTIDVCSECVPCVSSVSTEPQEPSAQCVTTEP